MIHFKSRLLILFIIATSGPLLQAQVDPELLSGIRARAIGPAGMSGRIGAVAAVNSNPDIVYVGAATGGVWKSVNGGLNWSPIFDDQPVASIGAIAINQASPDVVWVGTGEGNPRNSASVGNGVYKSLDGGRTWKYLGLDKTEKVHRILLHPDNRNIAYVAALGTTWGENRERGIYKTTDGGKSWQKILYVDARTGGADLAMDPTNPDKLIAAMWDHRRWPWSFRSGGPGSGLYITNDGGATWDRISAADGLPKGDLGRIGVAIARSNPNIVYAYIEAKKNAIYRSEDGGYTWKKTSEDDNIGNRPFYYADLRVDPKNPDRVYSLWSRVSVSIDGGKSFEILAGYPGPVHPDHHAMWINPKNPAHIIEGNDGGVYFSHDYGKTWRFVNNLPLAQYYHINVDMETPYNVYGGMQDNGSWRGPSSVWENGEIRNHHWEEVGFGDGFATLADPNDPMTGYAMSQEGFLSRWNLRTGQREMIRPAHPEDKELRFNWNAAIAIDPFAGNTVYYGSQYVHKSTNGGTDWTLISPDLTTNNPDWQKQGESGGLTPDVTGAENFTSILTIAPSPVKQGIIWVGTDDGRVHVTRNGGESWTSVEKNIKKAPANTWVPHIEPSKYDPAEAFIVLDNHRRADWKPYVYRTRNYGRSWSSLSSDDIDGYPLVIEQDPVDPDLLFLGTEFGLYVSLDKGGAWMKWTSGFPTVSAMAMLVHPREHDLVIGTHGRAAYIIDDIRPLRSLSAQTMKKPLHLFDIPPAQQYWVKQTGESRFPGQGEFRGENRPYGALITFSLNDGNLPHPNKDKERARKSRSSNSEKNDDDHKVSVTVTDSEGDLIRTFKRPVTQGVNRVVWNLRRTAFRRPGDSDDEDNGRGGGPEVLPGEYTVEIAYLKRNATAKVAVVADPRFDIAIENRQAKLAALMEVGALRELVADAVSRIDQTRDDIDAALAKAKGTGKAAAGGPFKKLEEAAKELKNRLKEVEKLLWQPPDTKGYAPDTHAMAKIGTTLRFLSSSWDRPTETHLLYKREAVKVLKSALDQVNQVFAQEVAAFRTQVQSAGIALFKEEEPLALPQ